MSLRIILVAFLHAVGAQSPHKVVGFLGDAVTLPSRADPSWNVSSIEWSILSNNTWIATHRNGKTNFDRFYRYEGRLSLNITSGDLMIRGLTRDDGMEYSADLVSTTGESRVNKVQLLIQEHLQKPTIKTLFSSPVEGGCAVGLQCSSEGEGVDFSWEVDPPNATAFHARDGKRKPGLIFTIVQNTEVEVRFTCITSRDKERVSSAVTQPSCVPVHCRNRCWLCFPLGLATGVVMTMSVYINRENIRAFWK